jgi:hypothetical protein
MQRQAVQLHYHRHKRFNGATFDVIRLLGAFSVESIIFDLNKGDSLQAFYYNLSGITTLQLRFTN